MRSPIFTMVCGCDVVGLGDLAERLVVLARQRHQRLAGRDDMHVLPAAGRGRRCDRRRRRAAARWRRRAAPSLPVVVVSRDDQTLAGLAAPCRSADCWPRRSPRPARRSAATRPSMVSPCCTVIGVPPSQFQPDLAARGLLRRRGTEPVTSLLAGAGLDRRPCRASRRRCRSPTGRVAGAERRSAAAAARSGSLRCFCGCATEPVTSFGRRCALERNGLSESKRVGVGAATDRSDRNRRQNGKTEHTERAAGLDDATHRLSHSYATDRTGELTPRG